MMISSEFTAGSPGKILVRPDSSRGVAAKQSASALPLWKRVMDMALLVVLAPGLLIVGGAVALVVMCGSRGPVFYRQRRVGYMGREFLCYKFRTMQADADCQSHREHVQQLMEAEVPMTKLDASKDPRLVPLGALLRATGLDELPQVVNIIRGEMSFVGPRPCIPYEYEHYKPWQRRRFNATPGLTGLWQVCGKNRTTFNEMIRLDIEYSERQSLGLDSWIILKTFPALLQQCLDMRAGKRSPASATPSPSMG